jgi:tetratricopeptide (TPR) repeat protein
VALRRAVDLAPDAPEAWVALVTHLGRQGTPEEAQDALARMRRKVPPAEVALTEALCAEALAHMTDAERCYRQALAARPSDGLVLVRAAAFFVRLDRPADSVPLLRRLLRPAVVVPDESRRWARRQLALALAFGPGEPAHREARELLGGDPAPGEPAARRARDLVEAVGPHGRAAALDHLGAALRSRQFPADEAFRLVQAYERAGDDERAHDCMLDVLAVDVQNPEYLAHHAGRLVARGRPDEARPWVARLERLKPGSGRVRDFRAALAARPRSGSAKKGS